MLRAKNFFHQSLAVFLLLVLALVAARSPVARAAAITTPPGLNPGDQYRLIFVTTGTRDGSSQDIAVYNAFATAQVSAIPALAALNTTWTAVASTGCPGFTQAGLCDKTRPAVNARDNTNTNPNVAIGLPIFGLNGLRIANNNADLWDGSLLNAITNQNGTQPSVSVLTGTSTNGTGPNGPLGCNCGLDHGSSNATNGFWTGGNAGAASTVQRAFYAMSGVLTVPQPTLDIPDDTEILVDGDVDVPVNFTANGHRITAAAFTLGFDPACLLFDATDSNSDGIPDAVVFAASGADWDLAVNTANAAAGSLRFVISHRSLGLIADGPVVTITFTGNCVGGEALTLSDDSFGNDAGASVNGLSQDGNVIVYAYPVAVNDAPTTDEDTAISIDILGNDSDPNGGAVRVTAIDDSATQGTVTPGATDTDPVGYDPGDVFQSLAEGESDSDSFSYTIVNDAGGTDSTTVSITINGVNDSPMVVNDLATAAPATSLLIDVLANDSDIDASDILQITVPGSPGHGSAVVESGQIRYSPSAGFQGVESFTYTISDGHTTASATLTVVVGIRGDCNQDGVVDAGDLPACILEIFDGDDNDNWLATVGSSFVGNPLGCDANQDTLISAGDLSCKVRMLLEGTGVSCSSGGGGSRAATAPAELALPGVVAASGDGAAWVDLSYRSQGNRATALVVRLAYDPTQSAFDSADRNGDNIPDGLQLRLPSAFQAVGFVWDGEIGLVIFSPEMAAIPDGVVASLQLTGAAGAQLPVGFSQRTGASLGDVDGASLPVILSGGALLGGTQQRLFLPAVNR